MTTSININSNGVAIGGYDPVAYFTDQRAELGHIEFTEEWHEASWRFTTAEHAAQFAEDPERYAPTFGGHCAFGASMGKTLGASPEQWRIIDGKLCLMKSGGVKTLSKVFTGKIAKAIESDR